MNALASTSVTIADSTWYTIRTQLNQSHVEATLVGQGSFTYDASQVFDKGDFRLYADKIEMQFDDLAMYDIHPHVPLVPGLGGMADASLSSGKLLVNGSTRGGRAIVEGTVDDDYLVQVDADLNGGANADIWVRRVDANNGYMFRLASSTVLLYRVLNGEHTQLAWQFYTAASPNAIVIRTSGTTLKLWVHGTLKINTTDSNIAAGSVAFGGVSPTFDNLKICQSTDDDCNDVGDDVFIDEDFASTSVTVSHDDAGNLIDDGTFRYVYDAWHRLVKVQSSEDAGATTIQTAEFDGMGRRMKKAVTNAGEHDGTTIYLFDGPSRGTASQICETRDGSNNMVQQFIHGTQYIDELVMVRVTKKGDLCIHQDANWNVIATTDLNGKLMERVVLTPYGEPTFYQEHGFGDYDGDGDVDATDRAVIDTGGACLGGSPPAECVVMDFDFSGTYTAADLTLFDVLPQGNTRHPGRDFTSIDQPFAHQGLLFEPEIGSYQVRHRQYDPAKRRWWQRDPLAFLDDRFSISLHYGDGMALYAFALHNPAALRDPSGLSCRVRYQCQLTSSSGGTCVKDCEYQCNELSRQNYMTGEISCDDDRIPTVTTRSRRVHGGWRCCCFTFDLLTGCATCLGGFVTSIQYHSSTNIPPCSRSTCRAGCDLTLGLASEACGLLPLVARQLCLAAAGTAQTACIDACNAYCTLP